jgi:hypothetical protein
MALDLPANENLRNKYKKEIESIPKILNDANLNASV